MLQKHFSFIFLQRQKMICETLKIVNLKWKQNMKPPLKTLQHFSFSRERTKDTYSHRPSSTATYKFSPLTHLIQLLHVSDDLSGVLHLQHRRSHHHSLLLVLTVFTNEGRYYQHNKVILYLRWRSTFQSESYASRHWVPFLTLFSWPPFL